MLTKGQQKTEKLRAEMRKAISDAGKWRSDMQAAQIALHKEREKSKSLRRKLDEQAAAIADKSAQISELKKSNAKLSGVLRGSDVLLSNLERENESIKQMNSSAYGEVKGLRIDIANLKAENISLAKTNSSLSADNGKLKKKTTKAAPRVSDVVCDLKIQNAGLLAENDKLKREINAK